MKKSNFNQISSLICLSLLFLSVNMWGQSTYRVGDMHPCGGKVISIDAGGQSGIIAAKNDVMMENVFKTRDAFKDMGSGWTLPDEATLQKMNEMKAELGMNKQWYWSSKQVSRGYWSARDFNAQKNSNRFSGEKLHARAIRKFDKNSKCAQTASVTFDPNKWYRLQTQFTGTGKSLDIINDAKDDKLIMAKTGNYTGQYWKIQSMGNGFYRLTTNFTGADKSLDIINDGKNNKLIMAKTGNYTGQMWKIEPVGKGAYRLTTKFTGPGKSLDIINDAKDNQVTMAKTGNYTGQFWKITEIKTTGNAGQKTSLNEGETLKVGEKIYSPNGAYYTIMQDDGNLCTYTKEKKFVWCNMVHGFKGAQLKMQTDGNLVVYNSSNEAKWSSETHPYFDPKFRSPSNKPVKLVMENSGKLQLYTSAGKVIWTNR